MNNNEDIILNESDNDLVQVKKEAQEINYKDVDVVINVPAGEYKHKYLFSNSII